MTFTFVSGGVKEILGYDVAEWLSDPGFWNDHLHPEDHDRMVGRLVRIATAGGPFDEEYRLLAKDGSWVWIRDIGHAVKDAGGSPTVVRGLMVEITDQRAREHERDEMQSRFRRVIEDLPAIVYLESVMREDNGIGRMLYVSPQVEEILGFPPAGVDRRPLGVGAPVPPGRPDACPPGVRTHREHRWSLPGRVPDVHTRRRHPLVPRRGDVDPRRGREPRVLAGDHVRHHRGARDGGTSARIRGPLPDPRRADPGDRVPRGGHRRRPQGRLHQRTGAGAHRDQPRGMDRATRASGSTRSTRTTGST